MELYVRPVTIFDKNIVTDFAQEHYAVNEKIEAGDCSLILGKSYDAVSYTHLTLPTIA